MGNTDAMYFARLYFSCHPMNLLIDPMKYLKIYPIGSIFNCFLVSSQSSEYL